MDDGYTNLVPRTQTRKECDNIHFLHVHMHTTAFYFICYVVTSMISNAILERCAV